jgi:flagellar motor switch protein FliN/FliY
MKQSEFEESEQSNLPEMEAAEMETPKNVERFLDVEMDVVVRFGKKDVPLRDIVRYGIGTMIELERNVDEPVELLVNGYPYARGEVVVVDGYYGVRITEIGTPEERSQSLISASL